MFWKPFKWGFLWSLFILIICFLPGNKLPESNFLSEIHFDKIIHAFIYMLLFILVINGAKKVLKKPFIITVIYCVVYGIIIELIQHFFILDRDGQVNDVYANLVGVLVGIIIAINKKNNNRIEPMNNLSLLLM